MRLVLVGTAVLCFCVAPAMAEMYPMQDVTFGTSSDPAGNTLQEVFNAMTLSPVAGLSSVDTAHEALLDSYDSYWHYAAGGSPTATIVLEVAGNENENAFGIYDIANKDNILEIFQGTDNVEDGGKSGKALLSFYDTGEVEVYWVDGSGTDSALFSVNSLKQQTFGFYLDSPDGMWYSDNDLNTDGFDHMLAYQGQGDKIDLPAPFGTGLWTENHFILAFEDLPNGGDQDWNDFAVLVESITPVPVPAAVLLGMLGLGAAGIRLRKHV